MIRTFGIGLLALALATPAAAQQRPPKDAPTLSKFESRRLPPDLVKQRIAEQLGDLLVAPAQRRSPGKPTRPLEDLWYDTTPRATYVPGVCQSDSVIFRFHPVAEASRPGDVPTRLVGVEASTGYRLVRPAAEANAMLEKQQDENGIAENPLFYPDAAACARMPTEDAIFTRADSPMAFLDAMTLLATAQADLKAGKRLEVGCDYKPYEPAEACRKAIADFDAGRVASITPCEGVAVPKGELCVRLDDWGGGLNIYKRWSRGVDEIVRVHMPEPPIILTHERRD